MRSQSNVCLVGDELHHEIKTIKYHSHIADKWCNVFIFEVAAPGFRKGVCVCVCVCCV